MRRPHAGCATASVMSKTRHMAEMVLQAAICCTASGLGNSCVPAPVCEVELQVTGVTGVEYPGGITTCQVSRQQTDRDRITSAFAVLPLVCGLAIAAQNGLSFVIAESRGSCCDTRLPGTWAVAGRETNCRLTGCQSRRGGSPPADSYDRGAVADPAAHLAVSSRRSRPAPAVAPLLASGDLAIPTTPRRQRRA